jgi:hypothetical protein
MYISHTQSSILFFKELSNSMLKINGRLSPDDQRDLYIALWKNGLHYTKKAQVNSTKPSYGLLSNQIYKMKIVLLPHSSYVRFCNHLSNYSLLNASVLHCLSPKRQEDKKLELLKYGHWSRNINIL